MSAPLIYLEPVEPNQQQTYRYFCLNLIDEGAANVVYKLKEIFADQTKSLPAAHRLQFMVSRSINSVNFTKMLLRARKAPGADAESQSDIVQTLTSHIPSHHIVQMFPVQAYAGLLGELNSDLLTRERDGRRPPTRCGSLLEESSPTLILVEDMSSEPMKSFAMEFKPKWLAQSPDAPKEAVRCRTCALRAMKLAQSPDTKVLTKAPSFCPLELMDGKHNFLRHAMASILSSANIPYKMGTSEYEAVLQDLVKYFSNGSEGNELLRSIKRAQQYFSPGPFEDLPEFRENTNDRLSHSALERLENAVTTMTLRDVSLFLRYTFTQGHDEAALIEAKLADLDKKSIGKIWSWKKTESKLREGGFYVNNEPNAAPETICLLSKQLQQH